MIAALALVATVAVAPEDALAERMSAVREAEKLASQDPAQGAQALFTALNALHDHAPALAKDKDALAARQLAQLSLARAQLFAGDLKGATRSMDEAIRMAAGSKLAVVDMGPTLAALYEQRREALAATGRIEVDCKITCRVFVHERRTDPIVTGLPRGPYRVWVDAAGDPTDRNAPTLRRTVTLDAQAPTGRITFGAASIAETAAPTGGQAPEPAPTASRDAPGRRTGGRMLPRWAEILGIALGAGAVGTGAALLAIHGKCVPEDGDACTDLYETQTGGIASLAAGGALLVAGSVTLAVDEVRLRKRRGATGFRLQYTLRF